MTLVLFSIRKDDFMASLVLKGVYFKINFHRDLKGYLCFVLEGVAYCFKCVLLHTVAYSLIVSIVPTCADI